MPGPLRSPRLIARIGGPLAALCVVTLLCGTTPEDAQLLAARRQRIAGMTHSEIEQLKRNYDEYRKLSPERRQALQALDDEVKQDAANGGHLLKLLTGYNKWLSTLSPFDQERINSKTDPVERAQVVKAVRDEQQKRLAGAAGDALRRRGLTLRPKDLDAMGRAVENNFLTAESRKKIPSDLTGRDRHLRIFKVAQSQLHAAGDAASEKSLISTLIEAIPNETARSKIQSQPAGRLRRFFGQVLARSLVNEWRQEVQAVFPQPAAIEEDVAKRLATMTPGKGEAQRAQLNSFEGRRMIGVQLALQSDDQFKDLRPVFFWMLNGLHAKPVSPRLQPIVPPDDSRDESETKAKSAD
jgi:hypothetical protein